MLRTTKFLYSAYIKTHLYSTMSRFGLPKRLQGSVPSVWNEYITLAMQYKPLNLGQGFPDDAAPEYVINALSSVSKDSNPLLHQYTRGYGHLRLVQALHKLYSRLCQREINPLNEILITCGAYEALYSSIMGHIEEGDEVIIIEPFFDCYEPMVKMAGGRPRFIPLKPKKVDGTITSADWELDEVELEQLFNNKTKMIILNNPHNPIGKVFTKKELETISALCIKWNVVCLSDEVYEWMTYDGKKTHTYLHFAEYVGSYNYCWICRENFLCYGLENRLGVWTRTFDDKFKNGTPKFRLYMCNSFARSCFPSV